MLRRIVVMAAGFALLATACGTGSVDEAEAGEPCLLRRTHRRRKPTYPRRCPWLLIEAPPAEPAPEEGDGSNEGIQVHGHWTIEVTNPDGSLASRTEFERADGVRRSDPCWNHEQSGQGRR